jgi:hypothetical protein
VQSRGSRGVSGVQGVKLAPVGLNFRWIKRLYVMLDPLAYLRSQTIFEAAHGSDRICEFNDHITPLTLARATHDPQWSGIVRTGSGRYHGESSRCGETYPLSRAANRVIGRGDETLNRVSTPFMTVGAARSIAGMSTAYHGGLDADLSGIAMLEQPQMPSGTGPICFSIVHLIGLPGSSMER